MRGDVLEGRLEILQRQRILQDLGIRRHHRHIGPLEWVVHDRLGDRECRRTQDDQDLSELHVWSERL